VRALRTRQVLFVMIALVFALGSAATAAAQASRLGNTFYVRTPDTTQPTMRYSDLAFDTRNNVYLVVWGMFPVKGQFLDVNGTPLGAPFWVPYTSASLVPRIAYSADADAFLVAYLDDTAAYKIENQSGRVLGRLVRYTAGGTPQFVTNEFVVSANGLGKIPEKPPVVAYSSQSREFLVAWTDKNGYVPSQPGIMNTDIRARRIQLVFNAATNDYTEQLAPEGEIVIAGRLDAEELPSIAYNPVLNQFMVAYMRETSAMSIVIGLVQAGSNALLNTNTIYTGPRENYPEIAYIAATGQFQVIWWHAQALPAPDSPDVWGRLVSASGVEQGAGATIIAGTPYFEGGPGLGLSYHPLSQTSFSVFQSPWEPELGGVQISSSGLPTDAEFPITRIRTDLGLTTARLAVEPRVTANLTDAATVQWLTVTGVDYSKIVGQRVQAGGIVTPSLPAPVSLTATAASASQINLAWLSGGGSPVDYHVERVTGASGTWTEIGTATGTAYIDTGLTCGTSYSYRVRAQASDGAFSAYSAAATTTTVACPSMPIEIDPTMPAPWYFAEGYTTGTADGFDTFYLIANEHEVDVLARIYFSRDDGWVSRQTFYVPAHSQLKVRLSDPVYGAGVPGSYGTVFQSLTAGRQIYVARSIFWGTDFQGSSLEVGTRELSTAWYFAEGTRNSNDFFSNYFLVLNPTTVAATGTITFFLQDGLTSVVKEILIPAGTRRTYNPANYPELRGLNFSASVSITNGVGVVAERAMYWTGWPWTGGHASKGVTAMSSSWYFAEGASFPNFETWYLVLNPNSTTVTLEVTYLLQDGAPIVRTYPLLPQSRMTIFLANEVGYPGGVSARMRTLGGEPIVAERSMYWNWNDGTNVFGATATASEWHLPEGAISPGFETYLLVSNSNAQDVTVELTLFSHGLLQADGSFAPGYTYTNVIQVGANRRLTVNIDSWLRSLGQNTASFQSFAMRVRAMGDPAPQIVVEEALYWTALPDFLVNYWRAGGASLGIRQ